MAYHPKNQIIVSWFQRIPEMTNKDFTTIISETPPFNPYRHYWSRGVTCDVATNM
jgi:hypothetical protein